MMMLIRYWNAVGGHGGDYMLYKEGHNELLGLPKESLDDEVAKLMKDGVMQRERMTEAVYGVACGQ